MSQKSEVFNVTKTERSNVEKTNYIHVAKSEVFNVTQTNFFNIAKSTTYLDITMSQRLSRNGILQKWSIHCHKRRMTRNIDGAYVTYQILEHYQIAPKHA